VSACERTTMHAKKKGGWNFIFVSWSRRLKSRIIACRSAGHTSTYCIMSAKTETNVSGRRTPSRVTQYPPKFHAICAATLGLLRRLFFSSLLSRYWSEKKTRSCFHKTSNVSTPAAYWIEAHEGQIGGVTLFCVFVFESQLLKDHEPNNLFISSSFNRHSLKSEEY
jgi:hypothetical protein